MSAIKVGREKYARGKKNTGEVKEMKKERKVWREKRKRLQSCP